MILSEHFSFEELTVTDTKLPNVPGAIEEANLVKTAAFMEIVRKHLDGLPIHVNSAFRSALVNAKVGGSKTSAHVLGYAVDFVCPRFGAPDKIVARLRDSGLRFDQLIYEHPPKHNPWVHISFDPRFRMQVLECSEMGDYVKY